MKKRIEQLERNWQEESKTIQVIISLVLALGLEAEIFVFIKLYHLTHLTSTL